MQTRRAAVLVLFLCAFVAVSNAVRGDGHRASPGGDPGYMGVQLERAGTALRVSMVVPGSPAATAGLHSGDTIVTADGSPAGTPEWFTHAVRAAGAGTRFGLMVDRGGQRVPLSVLLASAPARAGLAAVGTAAPGLAGTVAMGAGPADLAQLRGRVVIVDFFASWCGPCRMLMPVLNHMHQQYNAQGLTVLGVTDESASVAFQLGSQMAIGYTLASEPSAAMRYGVQGLPTTVVIDRHGTVRRVSVGVDAGEVQEIDRLVQRLLAEAP